VPCALGLVSGALNTSYLPFYLDKSEQISELGGKKEIGTNLNRFKSGVL